MVIFNPIFCGTPKKDSYFSILAIGPLPCCLVLTLLTMLSLRNSVAHTKFLQVFLVALHGPLLSGRPPGDGDAAGMAITVPADDACDIDDRNSSVKASQKEEITVKIRCAPSCTAASTVSPRVIHSNWLKHVQDEFGDHFQILDNRNRPDPKIDLLRWSDLLEAPTALYRPQNYPTLPRPNNQQITNPQQADTSLRLMETLVLSSIIFERQHSHWKQIKLFPSQISQLLRESSCFAYQHNWTEDVRDTTQLGFVTNLDPQFVSAAQATVKMTQRLKKVFPKLKRMVYSNPAICTREYYALTKAFLIMPTPTTAAAVKDQGSNKLTNLKTCLTTSSNFCVQPLKSFRLSMMKRKQRHLTKPRQCLIPSSTHSRNSLVDSELCSPLLQQLSQISPWSIGKGWVSILAYGFITRRYIAQQAILRFTKHYHSQILVVSLFSINHCSSIHCFPLYYVYCTPSITVLMINIRMTYVETTWESHCTMHCNVPEISFKKFPK